MDSKGQKSTDPSVKGSDTPTTAHAVPAGSTLTVTYRSLKKDGDEHYAVMPFPKTYEASIFLEV
jgi:hypothetical protein